MTATKNKEKEKEGTLRFEDALAELEEIVRKLETGAVPLEESLAAFERGVTLVRLLHGRLDAVQEKIEELTRSDQGKVQARPFDDD